MDPKETLKEIRALCKAVLDDSDNDIINCERLATLVQELDVWMSKGGFSPWDALSVPSKP